MFLDHAANSLIGLKIPNRSGPTKGGCAYGPTINDGRFARFLCLGRPKRSLLKFAHLGFAPAAPPTYVAPQFHLAICPRYGSGDTCQWVDCRWYKQGVAGALHGAHEFESVSSLRSAKYVHDAGVSHSHWVFAGCWDYSKVRPVLFGGFQCQLIQSDGCSFPSVPKKYRHLLYSQMRYTFPTYLWAMHLYHPDLGQVCIRCLRFRVMLQYRLWN